LSGGFGRVRILRERGNDDDGVTNHAATAAPGGRTVIGVGIIGYGVMGRTHAAAYAAAAEAGIDCRLIGIYSRSMRSGGGNLAQQSQTGALPPETRIYTSADELLADERIHVVSICTHTDSHVELALAALAAGKHVIVEKPVALTAEAVRPLAEAAARASTLCMPAMCMRFWPGWPWLYEQIRTGVFGAVRSASARSRTGRRTSTGTSS
jgi:predicted dehydrogenase